MKNDSEIRVIHCGRVSDLPYKAVVFIILDYNNVRLSGDIVIEKRGKSEHSLEITGSKIIDSMGKDRDSVSDLLFFVSKWYSKKIYVEFPYLVEYVFRKDCKKMTKKANPYDLSSRDVNVKNFTMNNPYDLSQVGLVSKELIRQREIRKFEKSGLQVGRSDEKFALCVANAMMGGSIVVFVNNDENIQPLLKRIEHLVSVNDFDYKDKCVDFKSGGKIEFKTKEDCRNIEGLNVDFIYDEVAEYGRIVNVTKKV